MSLITQSQHACTLERWLIFIPKNLRGGYPPIGFFLGGMKFFALHSPLYGGKGIESCIYYLQANFPYMKMHTRTQSSNVSHAETALTCWTPCCVTFLNLVDDRSAHRVWCTLNIENIISHDSITMIISGWSSNVVETVCNNTICIRWTGLAVTEKNFVQ